MRDNKKSRYLINRRLPGLLFRSKEVISAHLLYARPLSQSPLGSWGWRGKGGVSLEPELPLAQREPRTTEAPPGQLTPDPHSLHDLFQLKHPVNLNLPALVLVLQLWTTLLVRVLTSRSARYRAATTRKPPARRKCCPRQLPTYCTPFLHCSLLPTAFTLGLRCHSYNHCFYPAW